MKKYIIIPLMFIVAIALYSNILYVPQVYPTIQSAVNAANSGDEIVIQSRTNAYYENVNLDSFQSGSLIIRSSNPDDIQIVSHTVIKPSDYNQPTFVRTTVSENNWIDITFKGLTIMSGNTGVEIYDIFYPNYFNFYKCVFSDNQNAISSSSFYPLNIQYCIFKDNYTAVRSTHNWQQNRTCIDVSNSLFYSNYYALVSDLDMNVTNCSIADNNIGISCNSSNSNSSVKNSIIYGNDTQLTHSHGTYTITYSDIEGGFTGTGNIDKDPEFCMTDPYKYHLLETSPCIDAGDPNDTGGDVRIDMGCYETTTDIKPLKGNHWNWVSYPRTERPNNDPMNDCDFNAPAMLEEMIPFPNRLEMESYPHQNLIYDHGWSNLDYTVKSTLGYKLNPIEDGYFILPTTGTRLDSSYVVHLNPGENWTGFWLPGSENFFDAMGIYLNGFKQVKAENWTMTKVGNSWIGPSSATFDYGKGYIMYVDPDINPNGLDFHWNATFHSGGGFKKAKAENFTFEEKPNYEVIDIASIEGGEDITEIGAFVNGICVGASKVEGYPVQILAYTEDANKGGDDDTFYFEVVTGDKGKSGKINDISVYNDKTGKFEKSQIHTTGSGYHLIKLGKGDYTPVSPKYTLSLQNYPNPFNPETKITFSLPEDGKIRIEIYNIKGQKVRTLASGIYQKGNYNIVWNGYNDKGKKVGSGLYLYRLITKKKTITKKMLLLK